MEIDDSKPISPVLTPGTRRTLSKGMRVLNFFYKLTLAGLSATNFALIMFDKTVDKIHISETYFQVMSVLIAIVPIFWSKLLDSCKSINVTVPDTPSAAKTSSTSMQETKEAYLPKPNEERPPRDG